MRSFIGGASVVLLVLLAQRTLAGRCVRDCSTHCTRYEQAACNAEHVICNQIDTKMNYDTHTMCLQGHVSLVFLHFLVDIFRTHEVGNNGIAVNFVFPDICNCLHYL